MPYSTFYLRRHKVDSAIKLKVETMEDAISHLIGGVHMLVHDHKESELRGHIFASQRRNFDIPGFIDAYFRAGPILNHLTGRRVRAITMARISFAEEHQGQGHLTLLLDELEHFADDMHRTLMVENVMEVSRSRLARSLRRRAYIEHAYMADCAQFFRYRADSEILTDPMLIRG